MTLSPVIRGAACALLAFALCLWGAVSSAAEKAAVPPKLWGTIEFKGPLKGLPDWLSVMERNPKHNIFVPDSKLNANVKWQDFKAKLEKMSPMEQVKAVNTFWNQWPYRLDIENYNKEDYWAIPDEFRRKSGDCEDYCIVKFYTLKELGFTNEQMRIVVVKETVRNIAHAVLAVYMDNTIYILDNLSKSVLEQGRYKNYIPQFSVNEKNRWAHVRPK